MRYGWAMLCALVTVAIVCVAVPATDRQQPTRLNPLLFNYFRQQVLQSNVHEDVSGRGRADLDLTLLDTFACSLTRDFCLQVGEKLDDLERGFKQVQSARSEVLSDSGKARPGAQAEWSESLRRVARTAGKLHGMLRLVLAEIRHEVPSAAKARNRESDPGFEDETKVLGDQILRLDQRIKGFLSGKSLTISVEELRDNDILMLLSRVEAEAGEMEERLDVALQPSQWAPKWTRDCSGKISPGFDLFVVRRKEQW